MKTLVIATRNAHKVGEIRAILGAQINFLTLNEFPGAPAVVEDADTFAGNASKKSITLARWLHDSGQAARLGLPSQESFVLADDSGLEVDALNGAPGVHSARFAALDTGSPDNSSDAENCAKLLRLLKDVPPEKRPARFRCVIALTPVLVPAPANASPVCYADESELQTQTFEGACEGRIISTPRGIRGFGYDPLFIPAGHDQTFGELPDDVKNKLSHRARALAAMKQALRS